MAKNKIIKQDIFTSVVVVAKSQTDSLSAYVKKLSRVLINSYENYEIIVIDNAASVEQIASVNKLLSKLPCIRVIRLSRQFKHDAAVFCGVEMAIGDYVVVVDPMLDPIDEIPMIIEKNKSIDIIQGISDRPIKGLFGTDAGRKIFYWYNRKYVGIDISEQSTYFMSLSRRAVGAITSSARSDRHIRHLTKIIGYSYGLHNYQPLTDPGSQRSLKTGVVQALEVISSYSTHPLRFITWLGFVAGTVNLLYAGYVVVVTLFNQNVEPGWPTISLQLSTMFFILFMILVVLSEYIGRILNESRKDPQYHVLDEHSSTVSLADIERKNISKD